MSETANYFSLGNIGKIAPSTPLVSAPVAPVVAQPSAPLQAPTPKPVTPSATASYFSGTPLKLSPELQQLSNASGALRSPTPDEASQIKPVSPADTIRGQQQAGENLGIYGQRVKLPGVQAGFTVPNDTVNSFIKGTIETPERLAKSAGQTVDILQGRGLKAPDTSTLPTTKLSVPTWYESQVSEEKQMLKQGYKPWVAKLSSALKAFGAGALDVAGVAGTTGDIVLKATSYDAATSQALSRMGLRNNFTLDQFAERFNTALKNMATTGDRVAAEKLFQDTKVLVDALSSEKGLFVPNRATSQVQDFFSGLQRKLGSSEVPYNVAAAAEKSLPGSRPVPGTEPAFNMGMSTQQVEDVGKGIQPKINVGDTVVAKGGIGTRFEVIADAGDTLKVRNLSEGNVLNLQKSQVGKIIDPTSGTVKKSFLTAREDFFDQMDHADQLAKEMRSAGIRPKMTADGYITVYHGSSPENIQQIQKSGTFNDMSFFSHAKHSSAFGSAGASDYGKLMEIKVDPRAIQFSQGTGEMLAPHGLVRTGLNEWTSPDIANPLKSNKETIKAGQAPPGADPQTPTTTSPGPENQDTHIAEQSSTKSVEAFKLGDTQKVGNVSIDKARVMLHKLFPGDAQFLAMPSLGYENGKLVLGKYSKSLISIVEYGGKVADSTLYHEAFHKYMDEYVDAGQRKAILEGRSEEDAADLFAEWMAGKRTLTGRILQFFKDLLKKISSWMGKTDQLQNAFSELSGGKAAKVQEASGVAKFKTGEDIVPYDGQIPMRAYGLFETDPAHLKAIAPKIYDHLASVERATGKLPAPPKLPKPRDVSPQEASQAKKTFYETQGKPLPEIKPKKIVAPKSDARLAEAQQELQAVQERMAEHPGKSLQKYAAGNGYLPEVTGESGKGAFRQKGDQIATDAASKTGITNLDEAQTAVDEYRSLGKQRDTLKQEIQSLKKDTREVYTDKQVSSINDIIRGVANGKPLPMTMDEYHNLPKATQDKIMDAHRAAARSRYALSKEAKSLRRPTTLEALKNAPTRPLARGSEATSPSSTTALQQTPYNKLLEVQEHFPEVPDKDSLLSILKNDPTPVNRKVGIFDYLRTPDRILAKVGLKPHADLLRKQYEGYLKELPKNIQKITDWAKRVPDPKSSERIFKVLDGDNTLRLSKEENAIADEVQQWLKQWATRLRLPGPARISNYITHIFEEDFIKKEFDEDLAKIIRDKVPGSVYDPFLEKRLGARGYIEDVFRAMDTYVKRATRKVYLDPALNAIQEASTTMELSQYDYLKKKVAQINLRPTEIDNLLDNSIKQIVGYRFGARPTANITRLARRITQRAMIGLNVATSVKHLMQVTNTYAKLGTYYTFTGYTKMIWNLRSPEILDAGILKESFTQQDRVLSATKKFWEKTDKGLFVLIDTVDKINRVSTYFGAKAKGMSQGMSEGPAIEYAKKIVRDTHFSFSPIDTPVALSSDIARTLLQFISVPVKQAEFIVEMVQHKEYAGIIRYIVSTLLLTFVFAKIFGFKPTDIIPGFQFGLPASATVPKAAYDAAVGTPDKFGKVPSLGQRGLNLARSAVTGLIPAGTQGMKVYEGLNANKSSSLFDKSRAAAFGASPFRAQAKSAKADTKSNVQKIYDQVQELKVEGKTDEAQKLVDALTDSEYTAYKSIKLTATRDANAKARDTAQNARFKVLNLIKAGKTDEAQRVVDALTDKEYEYYQKIKAKEVQ